MCVAECELLCTLHGREIWPWLPVGANTSLSAHCKAVSRAAGSMAAQHAAVQLLGYNNMCCTHTLTGQLQSCLTWNDTVIV